MAKTHLCAVPGCGASCSAGMLMCKPCWYTVPGALRRDVNKTWRHYQGALNHEAVLSGLKAYRVARDAAIAAVLGSRP